MSACMPLSIQSNGTCLRYDVIWGSQANLAIGHSAEVSGGGFLAWILL